MLIRPSRYEQWERILYLPADEAKDWHGSCVPPISTSGPRIIQYLSVQPEIRNALVDERLRGLNVTMTGSEECSILQRVLSSNRESVGKGKDEGKGGWFRKRD